MAQMATVPVYKCRVCGKPVYVTHLSTTRPDASAEMLKALMQMLPQIALCDYHRAKRNHFATQGREEEFIRSELNPQTVILNVIDRSGLDYYSKEDKTDAPEGAQKGL